MPYRMIALDMDGTLLNSKKEVSPGTMDMIREAENSGKHVVLCTGRAVSELQPYDHILSEIRFGILLSGALLYDFREKKILDRSVFPEEETVRIHGAAAGRDVFLQLMSEGQAYIPKSKADRMADYNMGIYQGLYSETACPVEDILSMLSDRACGFEKINIMHSSPADRDETLRLLGGLHAEMALSEISNLELTPPGTDKGAGLSRLASQLQIPLAEVIAVGDADNDIPMLTAAGLSVAMGNAGEGIQDLCKVTVADNDHDGCAEAIREYLLS